MALAQAPRKVMIEGRPVEVIDARPPLPRTLDLLLAALRLPVRYDVHPSGTSRDCEQCRDHRFAPFREGRHVGLDGIVRDLRLLMCADCEAVCVRDVSIDRIAGLPVGRRGPLRRDLVLGWYSGARRNRREYR